MRAPRHGRRRGHGRPARAAARGRPAARPRRLRHEVRARLGPDRLPRGARATSSSPPSPTRSTRASACRRCSAPCAADAAIVTEPTELELIVAHKGFVWIEVEVEGRAAHGSRYEEGVDAIVRAGPILTGLGELDAALGDRTHPLLGRGSVHASLIEGGAEMSSYPGRCAIGLERRTLPGETAAQVEAEIAALSTAPRRSAPCSSASRSRSTRDAEIVHAVRDAAAEVLGARARARRRALLGRRRVHRRGGHPDRDVRRGRGRRPRGRGVGERRRQRRGHRDADRGRGAPLRDSRRQRAALFSDGAAPGRARS